MHSFSETKYINNSTFDSINSYLYYINLVDLLLYIIDEQQKYNEIIEEYFKLSFLFIIFYFLDEENKYSTFKLNSFYKPYYLKANMKYEHNKIIINEVSYIII